MTDQTPLNSIQFRKISPKFEKFPPSIDLPLSRKRGGPRIGGTLLLGNLDRIRRTVGERDVSRIFPSRSADPVPPWRQPPLPSPLPFAAISNPPSLSLLLLVSVAGSRSIHRLRYTDNELPGNRARNSNKPPDFSRTR